MLTECRCIQYFVSAVVATNPFMSFFCCVTRKIYGKKCFGACIYALVSGAMRNCRVKNICV